MKESKLYKGLLATIVVAALGALAIASADAKSELQGVSVKVSYADLNLETEKGVQTLYRRLKRASKEVSGLTAFERVGSVGAGRMQKIRQSYRNTLSNAVEKIDNERLSEIHAG